MCKYLAWLRETVARRRGLIPKDKWNFLWVVEFPMFEYHAEDGRYYAMHHPFTAPRDEDLERLESDPLGCRAKAYDVVLNGTEIGGGSIRIHRGGRAADASSSCSSLLRRNRSSNSGSCCGPCGTARRRTAGSPSASTAW